MSFVTKEKSPVFVDDRGLFFPLELDNEWVQSNISISKKFTFRGLHHQKGETAQTKKITVLQGEILDVIVDLRYNTFGQMEYFYLEPGDQIIVPKYYAHGFLALKENTIIQYLVDEKYSPENEISFDWESIEEVKTLITHELDGGKILRSPKDAEGFALTKENLKPRGLPHFKNKK